MPLVSLNMAIPIEENRDSQAYNIFSSTESVHSQNVNNKYGTFKLFELVLSVGALCAIYCTAMTNTITAEDLVMCTAFGALTFYAASFVILSINIKKPLIIINMLAILPLLMIGGSSILAWLYINVFFTLETKGSENQIWKLIYSILALSNGFLYMVETLFMCFEFRNLIWNS